MAYVSQELKAQIVSKVKAVLPKNWKATFSIRDHSTLVMKISQISRDDLKAMAYTPKQVQERLEYIKNRENYHHEYYKDILGRLEREMITHEKLEGDSLDFRDIDVSQDIQRSVERLERYFLGTSDFTVFENIFRALQSENYDHSDIQTDYFNVGYYVRLSIGNYDKPCKLV